jgi:hypothetical protein
LQAIMNEWTSADLYAKRLSAISNGVVGSDKKTYALVGGNGKARTVFDDGAVDILNCTTNPDPNVLDWLFAGMTDQIVNSKKKNSISQIF